MFNKKPFDSIVRRTAKKALMQGDWDRQRASAKRICEQFARGYDSMLLADEVGMGKTYVALAVMAHYVMQEQSNHRKVLLVTPPSAVLRHKWVQEIRGFNRSYLRPMAPREETGAKELRPWAISTYWELFRNLQDVGDVDLRRVTSDTGQAFLYALRKWALSRRHVGSRQYWPALTIQSDEDALYLAFQSQFSMAALWRFLDSEYALRFQLFEQRFVALKEGQDLRQELSMLLRDFSAVQDSFEPNVFVISMSSLAAPRRDEGNNQFFFRYMAAFLLAWRSDDQKQTLVKILADIGVFPAKQIRSWAGYLAYIAGLRDLDLYGLRASTKEVLYQDVHWEEWSRLRSAMLAGDASDVPAFFVRMRDQIFENKLQRSGIGLAVIDEVHNWKGGKHNAESFRKNYSTLIPHKLIMSATPFQIEEDEIRKVFSFITNCAVTSKSWSLVDELFGADKRLVTACLDASKAFAAAWEGLGDSAQEQACQYLFSAVNGDEVGRRAAGILADESSGAPLLMFAQTLVAYRTCIVQLQEKLSLLIVRHTKPRAKRHFCIGDEFDEQLTQRGDGQRYGLYRSEGYSNTTSAFTAFVGMRLGQLAMRLKKGPMEARARLMGGMTSSIGAYRKSQLAKDIATPALGQAGATELVRYQQMFDEILNVAGHPKVNATVSRALENFKQGNKTLIFCERLETLHEIEKALHQKTAAMWPLPSATERQNLLKRTGFVDNLWALSLVHAGVVQQGVVEDALNTAAPQVAQWLARWHLKPTTRRICRLTDIHVIASVAVKNALSASKWRPVLALFSAFAAVLDQDAGDIQQVPSYVSGTSRTEAQPIDEDHDAHDDEEAMEEVALAISRLYRQPHNFWCAQPRRELQLAFWSLLQSEAAQLMVRHNRAGEGAAGTNNLPLDAFFDVLEDLIGGARKIVLRSELLQRYKTFSSTRGDDESLIEGFARMPVGDGETMLTRLTSFITGLAEEDGSISQQDKEDSKRKSLWRGVFMSDVGNIALLDGSVGADKRVSLCAAFNSPLLPYILLCSSIGSEGIDLHRHCAEIILHDLPWNPARLEQRIGRLDRVDSLAKPDRGAPLHIRIPFLANAYEKYQYDLVFLRAQKFEILLGQPDFSTTVDEESYDGNEEEMDVMELNADEDVTFPENGHGRVVSLPPVIMEYIKIDLSVDASD